MVEEQCQQQLQEGMIENFAEYSKGLSESSDICAVVCLSRKDEAISPLLTEESSGKEAGEEPQKPTTQATNSPLPRPDLVHILPTPAAHSTLETPAAKAIPFALPVQYFRKLVASVQTFATISQTLAAAHIAWHRGWPIPKPSWFRFGAPGSP